MSKRRKAKHDGDRETDNQRAVRRKKEKKKSKRIRRRNRAKKVCPIHNEKLHLSGRRWFCLQDGCDMECADEDTSAPADRETRRRRSDVHRLFDPMWKDQFGPFVAVDGSNTRANRRSHGYRWLAKKMRLRRVTCHIGMFDLGQCEAAILFLTLLKERFYRD